MWERIGRAVAAGLVRPGAAEAMDRERALVARVRARQREPRVVTVVAGKGGVGTSTVATAVATVLAALRHDTTALLDPRHGTGSLGRRIAGQPAPTVAQLGARVRGHPATAPLRVHGSLSVVDGAPWHAPVRGAQVTALLDELREAHTFTVVDLGNHPSDNTRLILGRTHHVVVVTTPTVDALDAVRVALLRIRSVQPDLLGTVVAAVPSLHPRVDRGAVARLRDGLGLPADRTVRVPYDPALAGGGPLVADALRPGTREAYLRLAALVAHPGEPTAHPLAVADLVGT
jgi:MinD-like ATPase involved in chromosome partitioning or flagellar assembly